MNGIDSFYGGADMASILYGQDARQVPAWMYVQDQGNGVVGLVGSSRTPDGAPHPLRYGSQRTHQFIVGEIIVRPAFVIATDALIGMGLAGLATGDHDMAAMLDQGELVAGSELSLQRTRGQELWGRG